MNNLTNDCIELNKVNISDIESYIDLFCEKYNLDKSNIRPQEWTAIITFIGESYIKPNNILSIFLDRIPYKRYNFFLVNQLLDVYINLCNIYSQSITILGFSKISDISMDTIYTWNNDNTKYHIYINKDGHICNEYDLQNTSIDNRVRQLTIKPSDIYKKLLLNIEQNINDMVIDGRRRGVGPIVRFNKFYETHSTGGRDQNKPLLDSNDLALQLGIDTKLLELQDKKPGAGSVPGAAAGAIGKNK